MKKLLLLMTALLLASCSKSPGINDVQGKWVRNKLSSQGLTQTESDSSYILIIENDKIIQHEFKFDEYQIPETTVISISDKGIASSPLGISYKVKSMKENRLTIEMRIPLQNKDFISTSEYMRYVGPIPPASWDE